MQQHSQPGPLTIDFGLYVHDWIGPPRPRGLGEVRLGRAAFLSLLETYLGLAAPPATAAQRAAAYLVALRAADDPSRFFHESLQVDEVGTAAGLLKWRDEWHLSSWSGKPATNWPARLADMAQVEALAVGHLPPSEGERLAGVIEALGTRRVPVQLVRLQEDIALYPMRWQQLLAQLNEQGVAVGHQSDRLDLFRKDLDLGRLQMTAFDVMTTGKLRPLEGLKGDDGSVVVLQALSTETAEHWLANHCRSHPEVLRILVSERHGASVDDTFRVSGLATAGFDTASTLRPALQVLPLALETLWAPLDPSAFLDFLMHPVGPLPARIRRAFAAAFAQQPGIGGPAWTQARANVLAAKEEAAARAELDARIAFWLESGGSDRVFGAPIGEVILRIRELVGVLGERILARQQADESAADFSAATSQCAAVVQALQALQADGMERVKPRLVQQLCTEATSDSGNSLAAAQASCVTGITSAQGCIFDKTHEMASPYEVIWWMPSEPNLPTPHPWVAEEIRALLDAGVRLRDPAQEMRSLTQLWMRPLMAADTRLILVLPPEPTEAHPAWQLIQALAPQLPVRSLEAFADEKAATVALESLSLPPAVGAWRLDPHASWRKAFPIPARSASQSHSSLELQFHHPAVAVLKYAAGLQGGRALTVAAGTRLLGNLAHRVLERLFAQPEVFVWSEQQLDAWLTTAMTQVLKEEGIPLLALGAATQRLQFEQTMRRAVPILMEHLKHAGSTQVHPERELTGALNELELKGTTDLLVQLKSGATAALDLKWARSKRYKETLEKGEFLQLALYSEMIGRELGQPPVAVGYFTFQDTTLLTLTPNLFGPRARVLTAANGTTSAHLIEQAKASWAWRVAQWQGGHVEVIGDGLLPEPPTPPDGCLPRLTLGPWHGDYEAVFGQREDA